MNQQETANPSVPSVKQVRQEIVEKLTGALDEYKQKLGEKKLAIRVKKVSKLISRDLKRANKKKDERKKQTKAKKAAPKKAKKVPVEK
jgi:hypothetical protein